MQNNFAAGVLVLLVLIAIVVTQAVTIVQPGTVGVVTKFGAVKGIVQPGLHFKVPIMTQIIPLDTRVKKVVDEATASSKDLQIVTSKVALNYRIDPAQANTIYSELGPQFAETIVAPAIQESIKAITSQYTAERLITQRAEVKDAVQADIKVRLDKFNLITTEFSILDFNFSSEFNHAIEQKQVAQQAALRAQNDLARIETEAMQIEATALGAARGELARAKAEAEAQQLLRETLTPEVLQLRAIEKWDGVLPVYTGGDAPLPFLAVPSAPR